MLYSLQLNLLTCVPIQHILLGLVGHGQRGLGLRYTLERQHVLFKIVIIIQSL